MTDELFEGNLYAPCVPIDTGKHPDWPEFVHRSNQYGDLVLGACECGQKFMLKIFEDGSRKGYDVDFVCGENPELYLVFLRAALENPLQFRHLRTLEEIEAYRDYIRRIIQKVQEDLENEE